MSVIIILIGASLFVAVGFLISFIWSVNTGQYEDVYTPSVRMIMDSDKALVKKNPELKNEESEQHIN